MEFSLPYSREDVLSFLRQFLPDDFMLLEESVQLPKSVYSKHASKLGICKSLDLIVYEIIHSGKDDPRVGLSKEAFKMLSQEWQGRALVLFIPENNINNYRFSLIEIKLEGVPNTSKIDRKYSNPRRYSYLLGDGIGGYTPNKYLNERGKVKDIKDLFERFNVETLTEEFYKRLFDWYKWAMSDEIGMKFPTISSQNQEDPCKEEHLIRLITRLMFVWFIKQKNLIPNELFDENNLGEILIDFNPENANQGCFYNAILQNLFFATLNQSIGNRDFANNDHFHANKKHYGVKTLYRYGDMFKISQSEVKSLFRSIPFLNGGLFECLDKDTPDSQGRILYCDGFSRNPSQRAFVPNALFFDKDKGLINLLKEYNFTIEENTPFDQEVSLDPELLGKVFENLLASYNPETESTARKQTGSFYTPREVVQYMVDECLVAYLKRTVGEKEESEYRKLMLYSDEEPNLSDEQKIAIIKSLFHCKILDPACGSGAYPMGILQQMVHILSRLDKQNMIWEQIVREEAIKGSTKAYKQRDEEERKYLLDEVESVFKNKLNNLDYSRKLYLIENSIYGVDIQSIAVQISKLRFFISLIIEQQATDDSQNNYGIRPLPNLETKFVAANTLIGLTPKGAAVTGSLFADISGEISETQAALHEVRQNHFSARTASEKALFRQQDKTLRETLAKLLEKDKEYDQKDAGLIAQWDPYNQSHSSVFFDSKWMFGIKEGFDIVIGNPPYIQLQNNKGLLAKQLEPYKYKTFARTGDISCIFYERAWQLLKDGGVACYITTNKWMRSGYGELTRRFFANHSNPLLLIDFASVKIFKSATVDTNILLFAKEANQNQTKACVVKEKCIENLSDYIQQNLSICAFNSSNSWVILSPIEQQIKEKIERVGTPLKDWDIQINYGIKTGYNEAFIISGTKKDELIAKDPKSAEIIRPILRGRDIKRYGYEFADLWLINTHNGIKEKGVKRVMIDDYPAIKEHLDQYWEQINDRADQGDTPYNLRNCAYMDDFNRQKIIFQEMVQEPSFILDTTDHYYCLDTARILVGSNLYELLAVLNSKLFFYAVKTFYGGGGLGETGIRMKHTFFKKFPCPQSIIYNKLMKKMAIIANNGIDFKQSIELIDELVYKLYNLNHDEIKYITQNSLT